MVFLHLNHSYKFVNMKNNLSKKIMISFILILSTYFFYSFTSSLKPLNFQCGTDLHGIGFIDSLVCNQDVTITSLPTDGPEGSILLADIKADNIRIIPGAYSVRIIPNYSSLTQKTENTGSRPNIRRSLIGGNGGRSRKILNEKKEKDENHSLHLSYISSNQSLEISNIDAPITHYSIFNMAGILLTEIDKKQPLGFKIPLTHLPNGIYILRIQLENGEEHSKTFGKQ